MNWEAWIQMAAYVGSVAFYGGRLLGRVQNVEEAVKGINRRVDELVGGTTGPITIVAAASGADTPQRGRAEIKPPKAKAS